MWEKNLKENLPSLPLLTMSETKEEFSWDQILEFMCVYVRAVRDGRVKRV